MVRGTWAAAGSPSHSTPEGMQGGSSPQPQTGMCGERPWPSAGCPWCLAGSKVWMKTLPSLCFHPLISCRGAFHWTHWKPEKGKLLDSPHESLFRVDLELTPTFLASHTCPSHQLAQKRGLSPFKLALPVFLCPETIRTNLSLTPDYISHPRKPRPRSPLLPKTLIST